MRGDTIRLSVYIHVVISHSFSLSLSQHTCSLTHLPLHICSLPLATHHTHTHQVLPSIPKPITASLNSLQGPKTLVQVNIPSLSLVVSPATVRLILQMVQSVGPDKVRRRCYCPPYQFIFPFLSMHSVQNLVSVRLDS